MYTFWLGTHVAMFGRSGSSIMTALIGFERYIVVTFPLKKIWFCRSHTRFMIFCVTTFALLMAIPRFISMRVMENHIGKNISVTKDLSYIVLWTSYGHFWYGKLFGIVDLIDYLSPAFPLLIFNGLLYFQVCVQK